MSLKQMEPGVVRGVHLFEVDHLGRLKEPRGYRSSIWTPDGSPDTPVKSQYGGISFDEEDKYVVGVVESNDTDVVNSSDRNFTSRNSKIVALAYTKPRSGFWHGIFHGIGDSDGEIAFGFGVFFAIVGIVGLIALIVGIATTTAAAVGWGVCLIAVGLAVISFIGYGMLMDCEGRCVHKRGSYRFERREYLKSDSVARVRQNYSNIPFFDSSAAMLRVVDVTRVEPKVVAPTPDNDPNFWSRSD